MSRTVEAEDVMVRERLFRDPVCCQDITVPPEPSETRIHKGPTHARMSAMLGHLQYLSAGITVFFCGVMAATIGGGGGLLQVAQGPFSAFVTMSLFFAAVGVVLVVFFWGLREGTSPGDSLNQRRWHAQNQARDVMSVDDFFALAIAHFNYFAGASANPLVFNHSPGLEESRLLYSMQVAIVPKATGHQDADRRRKEKLAFLKECEKDPQLWRRYTSYVVFIPAGKMEEAVNVLAPLHRELDEACEQEEDRRKGKKQSVGWDVHNIAPTRKWESQPMCTFSESSGVREIQVSDAPPWAEPSGEKALENHYSAQEMVREQLSYCEKNDFVGFTVSKKDDSGKRTVSYYADHFIFPVTEGTLEGHGVRLDDDLEVLSAGADRSLVGKRLVAFRSAGKQREVRNRTQIAPAEQAVAVGGKFEAIFRLPDLMKADKGSRFHKEEDLEDGNICNTYFHSWQVYPYNCLVYSWWNVPELEMACAEDEPGGGAAWNHPQRDHIQGHNFQAGYPGAQ